MTRCGRVPAVLIGTGCQDGGSRSTAALPAAARAGVVVVVGLAMGALTDVLQTYLGGHPPWGSLVNAASPWLVPAFAVGAIQRRAWGAALAGVTTCLAELAGYYVTSAVRGYYMSDGRPAIIVFWSACALAGGPVFGVAGRLWWRGPGRLRSLGPAVVGSAFLAEAAVGYGWYLRYWSSAALFAALGLAAIASLGWRDRQYARVGRWLTATLPAGVAAFVIVEIASSRSW